jgi:hypothetical protein
MSVSPKTPSGISGAAEEIQPHQHLIGVSGRTSRLQRGPEGVDGAKPALYKSANGGGRNPAAAVLWVAPSCEQLCSGSDILRDTRKTHSVDLAFERPARPSPTTQRSVTAEG